jgi:hypothetical protein
MHVQTFPRPYTLTFSISGNAYPLSQEEADRLIAEYPLIRASRNRIELRSDEGHRTIITAATLGGGPAFEVTR